MKNWNKTGKIKAIILLLIAILNLVMPFGATGEKDLATILMPLIFGSVILPLIAKFNEVVLGREIIKPNWNDNPFDIKLPLSFFYFGSLLLIAVGLSMILGTGIKYRMLNFFGFTPISFGIGILIGIWLTLKWAKAK